VIHDDGADSGPGARGGNIAIVIALVGLAALVWLAPGASDHPAEGATGDVVPGRGEVRPEPKEGDRYPLLREPRAPSGDRPYPFPPDERLPRESSGRPGL
jgi:hypothetical protein